MVRLGLGATGHQASDAWDWTRKFDSACAPRLTRVKVLLQDGASDEAADDSRDEARYEQNRIHLRLQVGHELIHVGVTVLGAHGGEVRICRDEKRQEVADDPATEHAVRQDCTRC